MSYILNLLGFYLCSFFLGAFTVTSHGNGQIMMGLGLAWFAFWITIEFKELKDKGDKK